MTLPTHRLDDQIVQLWSKISSPASWRYARSNFGELLTPFNPRYPQPGFIGNEYFESRCRVLLMGINPGPGKGYEAKDRILFDSSLRLARDPSAENLNSLMSIYREQMPAWTIFSRHGIFNRLGLSLDRIAFMNVLHLNTDVGPAEKELEPVYKYVITKFTSKQLYLLQPHAILHLGKHGWLKLNEYWPESDRPSGLKTLSIWHPSTRWVGRDPAGFETQLEEARRFLMRRKRQVSAQTS